MHCATDTAGPPKLRHPHIRAALPPLADDTPVDLATLRRVAAALREPSGRHRARPSIPADIARLRRDMGETIARLWAAPLEEVRYAC